MKLMITDTNGRLPLDDSVDWFRKNYGVKV